MVDHDPRRLMTSVTGSEYGPSAFASARLGILRIPAIGPTAFALRREERDGFLGRQADSDLGGATDSRTHAVSALVGLGGSLVWRDCLKLYPPSRLRPDARLSL
jgi:hypothetical protein